MCSGITDIFFCSFRRSKSSIPIIRRPRTLQTIIRPATENDSADQERQLQSVSFRYSAFTPAPDPRCIRGFTCAVHAWISATKTRSIPSNRCRHQTSTAASLAGCQLSQIIRGIHRSATIHRTVGLGTTPSVAHRVTDTGVPSCTPESHHISLAENDMAAAVPLAETKAYGGGGVL
ncbi:hypothetical protein BDV11DRAFT_3404 [Aspergillus similis]